MATDLSPLEGMTELEYLQIPAEVESLAPLAGLTNLRQLYIESYSRNSQEHIQKDISALRNLTNLSLWMGEVEDLSPLSGLTELTEEFLEGSFILKDFTPFQNLVWIKKMQAKNKNF